MRMIKDYRAITNGKYRLVCNVLIPIILGVILALIDAVVRNCYVTVVMFGFGAAFVTAIEVMGDYWGFGAICVKGCLGMDYLKTSTTGKAMLRNALTADLLVRPVRIANMYGAGGCAIWNHGGKSGETVLPVGAAHSKSVGVGAEHYEICPKRSGHECAVHAGIWSIGSCGYIYNDIFGIAEVYMADNGSTGGIAAGWNICDAQTYVPQG